MARARTSKAGRRPPTLELELDALARGNAIVAGIDEAGRGPWAGPVVAAAVVLDTSAVPDGIDDSKALDAPAREALYAAIMASGAAVGIGIADVERIDAMNILRATMWAMSQAVAALPVPPVLALVDGNMTPPLPCRTCTIVGGDGASLSIAAASIVAKVTRDRIMVELERACPGYGFGRHKGYGTPAHRAALEQLGVTPHHRRSFRPVQLVLASVQCGPDHT